MTKRDIQEIKQELLKRYDHINMLDAVKYIIDITGGYYTIVQIVKAYKTIEQYQ